MNAQDQYGAGEQTGDGEGGSSQKHVLRKRRGGGLRRSAEDNQEKRLKTEGNEPVPFSALPDALAAVQSARFNLGKFFALGIALGERVAEHDWGAVGEVAAVLCKRFESKSWQFPRSFPREIVHAVVEALRAPQSGSAEDNYERLKKFLRLVINRPDKVAHSGGARMLRVTAALELLQEQVAAGEYSQAFEEAFERRLLLPFTTSAIYHFHLGNLILYVRKAGIPSIYDEQYLLSAAVEELQKAVALDPTEYAYVHALAEALEAQNRKQEALSRIKEFCEKNSDDVHAREDLLRLMPSELATARELLKLNPMSRRGWDGLVASTGSELELAEVAASRIDHSDSTAWLHLLQYTRNRPGQAKEEIWLDSSRYRWWPSVFFRDGSAEKDMAADVEVARAKATVARSWERERLRRYYKAVFRSLSQDREPLSGTAPSQAGHGQDEIEFAEV
eukprot:CAMPEP_0198736582 /NCGR_PEP_ID=MMETSP1475-20131203/66705_1 /TAXON_ID= ORGANISM="Unidentified sp., Strain CCMP1999" /NCGR_SAMPLE_ID=MMETSP1475 /ASSEMBLY_ACC=CAM_ASM_001111 /LENGTH=447 /DNA_ID=CAMNT_0044500411 /DNA_START=211 /DNA_END=1554 /DNA_ORIENTATION=-